MVAEKVSNEQVIAAYRETGSVWAAGKKLGVAGQTVHKRLSRLGHEVKGGGTNWSPEEEQELVRLVSEDGLPFLEIANRLDRTVASVAVRASRLGIKSNRVRVTKIRRGRGLSKAEMERHMRMLENGEKMTPYVRRVGLKIGPFVRAAQTYWPERWADFAKGIGLATKSCTYCEREFYPTSARQAYCEQRCTSRARTDREYFGGRRRMTVGLDQGQCQLCGGKPKVGLSSHHIFGKENDPDNLWLMALCRGCHDVVTRVAARKWATDDSAMQRLVWFANVRARGAEIMRSGVSYLPGVEVNTWDEKIDEEFSEITMDVFSDER